MTGTGGRDLRPQVDRFGNIAAQVVLGGGPGAAERPTGASAAPAAVAGFLRELADDVARLAPEPPEPADGVAGFAAVAAALTLLARGGAATPGGGALLSTEDCRVLLGEFQRFTRERTAARRALACLAGPGHPDLADPVNGLVGRCAEIRELCSQAGPNHDQWGFAQAVIRILAGNAPGEGRQP